MSNRLGTVLLTSLLFLCHCEKHHTYLEKPLDGEPQQNEQTLPSTEDPKAADPRDINRKHFSGEKPLEAISFYGPKFDQRYIELRVNSPFFQKGEISYVNIYRADGEREPELRALLRPNEMYFSDEEVMPLGIYHYHAEVVYSDGAKDVSPKVRIFTPPHDTFADKPVTGPFFSRGYHGFGRVYFDKNLNIFTRGQHFKISDVQELHIDGELRIHTGSADVVEALTDELDPDKGLIWIDVDQIVGGTLIFEGTGLGANQGPNTPPIFVRVANPEIQPTLLDRTEPAKGGKKLPVCFIVGEERKGDCDPKIWDPYGISVDEPGASF